MLRNVSIGYFDILNEKCKYKNHPLTVAHIKFLKHGNQYILKIIHRSKY